jgi:hypothetical protein
MAAVAFVETLIFKGQSNGRVIHYPLTCTDVANAYAVSPDGDGYIQLASDQNYALIDAIVVVGGTDTNFQDIFVNGLPSELKISNKSNLNTSDFRQFATAPVVFKAGTKLKLKQTA